MKKEHKDVFDKLAESCVKSAIAIQELTKTFHKLKLNSLKKTGSKYHS